MAHIHEKIDYCSEVFVVNSGRVLLRLHDKYKIWLSVGGHIELHEDPTEAAVREVKEEVGLDVVLWDGHLKFRGAPLGNVQLIPPVAMNRHAINDSHEHIGLIFFGSSDSDDVVCEGAQDRSDEWRWLTAEELDELDLRDDVRFYALEALKTLA